MDPEHPIYSIHHRIDKSCTEFERDNLERRIEAKLERERAAQVTK